MKVDLTLAALTFLIFIIQCPYSIPFPFLPKVAKDKGITESQIGVILASFDIGQIITSLLFGKLMYFFSKRNLLYITILLCGLCTFLFGLLD